MMHIQETVLDNILHIFLYWVTHTYLYSKYTTWPQRVGQCMCQPSAYLTDWSVPDGRVCCTLTVELVYVTRP